MTEFQVEPQPYDETDKEIMYELCVNKERVLLRVSLKDIMDKIKQVIEAFHSDIPKEKKDDKEKKK